MKYPNQKRITIQKEECNNKNRYAVINLQSLNQAMRVLNKGSSFKLWMYLAKNQNEYEFDLGKVDCSHWGLKADSYHSAVKDLTQKGYLQEIAPNRFVFKEQL